MLWPTRCDHALNDGGTAPGPGRTGQGKSGDFHNARAVVHGRRAFEHAPDRQSGPVARRRCARRPSAIAPQAVFEPPGLPRACAAGWAERDWSLSRRADFADILFKMAAGSTGDGRAPRSAVATCAWRFGARPAGAAPRECAAGWRAVFDDRSSSTWLAGKRANGRARRKALRL